MAAHCQHPPPHLTLPCLLYGCGCMDDANGDLVENGRRKVTVKKSTQWRDGGKRCCMKDVSDVIRVVCIIGLGVKKIREEKQ